MTAAKGSDLSGPFAFLGFADRAPVDARHRSEHDRARAVLPKHRLDAVAKTRHDDALALVGALDPRASDLVGRRPEERGTHLLLLALEPGRLDELGRHGSGTEGGRRHA